MKNLLKIVLMASIALGLTAFTFTAFAQDSAGISWAPPCRSDPLCLTSSPGPETLAGGVSEAQNFMGVPQITPNAD